MRYRLIGRHPIFQKAFNWAPKEKFRPHATSTLMMKDEFPAGARNAHITTFQEKAQSSVPQDHVEVLLPVRYKMSNIL